MAVLAFQTEETGVEGRLGVALHTLGDRSFISAIDVAIQAGDRNMRTFQRKDQLVVKALHGIPPIMAFQAGRTNLGGVLLDKRCILLAVAGRARADLCSRKTTRVADNAGHGLALIIQGMKRQAEIGARFVIERRPLQVSGLPACRVVTLVAIRVKHTGVAGGQRVAIHTRDRDPAERAGRWNIPASGCAGWAGIGMAVDAAQGAVLPLQWESGGGVIELRQAILAIVAGETGKAKILVVTEHKSGILRHVTGIAARHIGSEGRTLRNMAGSTSHRGQVIVEQMVGQTEVCASVVEKRQGR